MEHCMYVVKNILTGKYETENSGWTKKLSKAYLYKLPYSCDVKQKVSYLKAYHKNCKLVKVKIQEA